MNGRRLGEKLVRDRDSEKERASEREKTCVCVFVLEGVVSACVPFPCSLFLEKGRGEGEEKGKEKGQRKSK